MLNIIDFNQVKTGQKLSWDRRFGKIAAWQPVIRDKNELNMKVSANNAGNYWYSATFVPYKMSYVKNLINAVINFFYPYFRRLMPLQTFKYAACGGGNTLLDIFIYYIGIHLFFKEPLVPTPIGLTIKQHVAAQLVSFSLTFPLGFYLSRTIVFPGSTLRGRIQLFRYFLLVVICFGLNYVFIRLFVEQCHLYPTVSKILTTFIVVAFSFVTQRNFTFKVESPEEEAFLEAEAVIEAEALEEEKTMW